MSTVQLILPMSDFRMSGKDSRYTAQRIRQETALKLASIVLSSFKFKALLLKADDCYCNLNVMMPTQEVRFALKGFRITLVNTLVCGSLCCSSAEPRISFRKFVKLDNPIDHDLLDFQMLASTLTGNLPGGLAGPLRYDNFVARSFYVHLEAIDE